MSRTGVVVVTYNSAGVIEGCLASCGRLPVVVVDNKSDDGTVALVQGRPDVKLIANSSNCGFAQAVNQGVAALDNELVLLLNPDTQLEGGIEELEAACTQPGVGLAAGCLRDGQGQAQAGFALRRFPTPATLIFESLGLNRLLPWTRINRRYRCLDLDLSSAGEVEQPAGAFLMFRREVWHRLGGFDTRFHPLWFEDVDFCRRAQDLGLKIQYVPQVTARHQGGHSIAGLEWSCREVYWYVSLLKYASKHFRPHAYRGVSAAVLLGSVLRTAVEMVRRRSFRPIKVYAKIGRLAGRSLISGRVGELNCFNSYSKAVG